MQESINKAWRSEAVPELARGGVGTDKASTPMEIALARLNGVTQEGAKLISVLGERLEPLLVADTPDKSAEARGSMPAKIPELIMQVVDELQKTNSRVDDLLHRLTL